MPHPGRPRSGPETHYPGETPPPPFQGRQLPSLPHILLKLIAACRQEDATIPSIARIIETDPALSARVIRLVNSAWCQLAYEVTGIEHAITLLGMDAVKNIAISTAVGQVFNARQLNPDFDLKAFWRHSLLTAIIGKSLAETMNLNCPDQAFLAGLLHDIGRLVEAMTPSRQQTDNDPVAHARIGAALAEHWQLGAPLVDAIAHHHDPEAILTEAPALTRLTHAANRLAQATDGGAGVNPENDAYLSGIPGETAEAASHQALATLTQVADSLGIPVTPATPRNPSGTDSTDAKVAAVLTRQATDYVLLTGTLQQLVQCPDQASILRALRQGLEILTDAGVSGFFLTTPEGNLAGHETTWRETDGGFTPVLIPLNQPASILTQALRRAEMIDSFTAGRQRPLSAIDLRIIRQTGGPGMACLPLIAGRQPIGVIVLRVRESDLPALHHQASLLRLLADHAALALRLEHARSNQDRLVQSERLDALTTLSRRVIHEVSNPLTVMKNYIRIIDQRLGPDHSLRDELRIFNDEIDRITRTIRLLEQFSGEDPSTSLQLLQVNDLVGEVGQMLNDALLAPAGIALRFTLEPNLPAITSDRNGLAQVLRNLIQNAAEALAQGGDIHLSTRSIPTPNEPLSDQGIEITVADTGPGIPSELRPTLFEPFVGTKGGSHSGLGLAISRGIVSALGGTLELDPHTDRATFIIRLPRRPRSRA